MYLETYEWLQLASKIMKILDIPTAPNHFR